MSAYAFIGYILVAAVFILVFIVLIVVFSKINFGVEQTVCPFCKGALIYAFVVNDDREDLVICNKCETLFRQFDGGELFEVFGHPPLTKGGNHEQRRTD